MLQSIEKDENIKAIVVVDEGIKFDELKKLKERKACGVRLNLIGKELPNFKTMVWTQFFENLSKLKMQIEIQRDLDNNLVDIVKNLIPYGCNIVIDHLARANANLTNLEDLICLKILEYFLKLAVFIEQK